MPIKRILFILFALCSLMAGAFAQARVEAWGNVTGFRKKGQLHDFETLINVISADGTHFNGTGKERQHPAYSFTGNRQFIRTAIDSLHIAEEVIDEGSSKFRITVNIKPYQDAQYKGIYFCLLFHNSAYLNGSLRFLGGTDRSLRGYNRAAMNYDDTAKGIEFHSAAGNLKLTLGRPAKMMIRRDTSGGKGDLQLYIAIRDGDVKAGDAVTADYIFKVSGKTDNTPVNLSFNAADKGKPFAGLGGNFRLQNPVTDPQVINYSLDNLHVVFGRVELPWEWWQPYADIDPLIAANAGSLKREVVKDMEMAHRLDSLGIPMVLSVWYPPQWAVTGTLNRDQQNGIWGNQLDSTKMDAICRSLAAYLTFLKSRYHTEPGYFSFNEPNLGVNVRMTPQQHDDFIKACGAYFAAHNIKTKMLLGDNSDPTSFSFIVPALNDPAARPFIGAVAFHSWRGWDKSTLQQWRNAATALNVPLLVTEGSIDAAAYKYPDVFNTPDYALNEINLYIRLLNICQPESILQWQLTADYSPMVGGGIFNNNDRLHPGRRFYNLKQLSLTPPGLPVLACSSDKADVTFAALGDVSKNRYAFHIVNNSNKRKVSLSGLPPSVSLLSCYTTGEGADMKKGRPLKVKNGTAEFKIDAASYVTLISE